MDYFSLSTRTIAPLPEKLFKDPLYFIAFGFGSGAIPIAPGTCGSLMAIPFYLLMHALLFNYYLLLVTIFALLAMLLCQKISNEIKMHDHPGMCIDEFIGFFVTMIAAPAGFYWILFGFLLFRFFDIVKPWPIDYLDRHVLGGFGMVLDDIVAGIFAMCILQLTHFLLLKLT